jgi:hypothetical protein
MFKPILMLVFVAAVAGCTAWLGWWTLPVLAAAWGFWYPPLQAGIACAVAWGGLLAWQASRAPVMVLAERLSGIFALPPFAVLLLTPAFAALLGWSAAAVVRSLVPAPTGNR